VASYGTKFFLPFVLTFINYEVPEVKTMKGAVKSYKIRKDRAVCLKMCMVSHKTCMVSHKTCMVSHKRVWLAIKRV
jgi:hypothetical protein